MIENQREGTNGMPLYLHRDHLGSVIAITDDNAKVLNTYEYYPFGELTTSANKLGNFAFTGQEMDWGINLYHFPARYYEPQWGRFITSDPLINLPVSIGNHPFGNIKFDPKVLNMYVYVSNNPANFIDPLGLFEKNPGEPFNKCYNRCVNSPEMIEANEFLYEWSGLEAVGGVYNWMTMTGGSAILPRFMAYGSKSLADWLELMRVTHDGRKIIIPLVDKSLQNIFYSMAKYLNLFGKVLNVITVIQSGLAVGWTFTGKYANVYCALNCMLPSPAGQDEPYVRRY